MFAPDAIREIRANADIVGIIGSRVTLQPSGKHHKGCCPFHDERSPSFFVSTEKRTFKCFGCGEQGDIIDFVQKIEGKSWTDTVRALAAVSGIDLGDGSTTPVETNAQREAAKIRTASLKLLETVTAGMESDLATETWAAPAREYVERRGLPPDITSRFRVGYAAHETEMGWRTATDRVIGSGMTLDMAVELGVCARGRKGRPFDQMRGRLMFPIIDLPGPIAFSGRILPAHENSESPKYLNSPETRVYKKGEVLYGLTQSIAAIRTKGYAVMVEGNVDVLTMHSRKYRNTVAPLGTALTDAQCILLARHTDTVYLAFDGDRAGLDAAWKALTPLLKAGLDARVCEVPKDRDPDTCTPEQVEEFIAGPRGAGPLDAVAWALARMVDSGAMGSPQARMKAANSIGRLAGLSRERFARDEYARLIAYTLDMPMAECAKACEPRPAKAGKRTQA